MVRNGEESGGKVYQENNITDYTPYIKYIQVYVLTSNKARLGQAKGLGVKRGVNCYSLRDGGYMRVYC